MRAILTYHSIDPSGSAISCHPDTFDRHVAWFASGRVEVTTIEALVAMPADADAVAITFDDGCVNFQELAAPRLLAHGLPVTLFVVPDRVGQTNAWNGAPDRGAPHLPLLGWPALARLQDQGVRIGAHSRTHPDLTRLDPLAIEAEVGGSADIIEQRLGQRPSTFAYPYGRLDARSVRAAAAAFSYACTTEFRVLDGSPVPACLPRLDMFYFSRTDRLEGWGSPELNRYVARRHWLRRLRRSAEDAARGVLSLRKNR